MKVLVIGKGGREHAIAKALSESASVEQVYAMPGSHGMQPEIQCLMDQIIDAEAAIKACQDNQIDLVVVGPEDPLVAGISDPLRATGVPVFGPDQKGAQLEGSKLYSKIFMEKYDVPTAPYKKVTTVSEVKNVVADFTPPYVLKADGLAAGKGVFICKTEDELFSAAESIFEKKSLGSAGDTAILEQFQPGYELSFFVLTNGEDFVALPMAQDHKRLLDGDEGPNTGGMGTVAPMKVSDELYNQIIERVVKTTVTGLKAEGFTYRGVVFIGLMVTEDGPQVLEYNIRFGDPETQVLMPLLDGDWGETFMSIAKGEIPQVAWNNQAAACVVLAAENYPASPVKGVSIEGDMNPAADKYFLHAGTKFENNQWLTNGGRVLNSIGLGSDIKEALQKAYDQTENAKWSGRQMRKDIGKKVPSSFSGN